MKGLDAVVTEAAREGEPPCGVDGSSRPDPYKATLSGDGLSSSMTRQGLPLQLSGEKKTALKARLLRDARLFAFAHIHNVSGKAKAARDST
jgi:hypothetical protein